MAKGMVRPGAKLIDVADAAEKFLRDKGYGIAFPMNISVNEQAAHYTPCLDDDKAFSNADLVKIDFGAEKDGYLGDCAITIDLSGKYSGLVSAANEAMAKAISIVKAGVQVSEIGKVIAESIESKGFSPIKNLGVEPFRSCSSEYFFSPESCPAILTTNSGLFRIYRCASRPGSWHRR